MASLRPLLRAFPSALMLCRQLLLMRGRHRIIVAQLNAVIPMPARERIQPRLVIVELRQRHLARNHHGLPAHRARAVHLAAPRGKIADDVAHRRFGRHHLDIDNRFEHDRLRFEHRIDKRLASRRDECHFLRIDGMALAVIHDHAHILHWKARERSAVDHLQNAFLHRRHELRRNRAAFHGVHELEARAARQRLHAQHDLAELPCAARLLLVAAVALGLAAYRLAPRDRGRARDHVEFVLIGEPLQHIAQMQFAQPAHHGFVGSFGVIDLQARVFGSELLQHFPHALFVAGARRFDGEAVNRIRKLGRREVDVAVLGGVVQHGVEGDVVGLGHRADIARPGALHLHMLLALQHEQMRDLERLPRVADIKLAVARDGALMNAKHGHLADIRVHHDLEHVREHVLVGVRLGAHGFLAFLAVDFAIEQRRVAFGHVGQQPHEHVEQLRDARTCRRGGEAHRHQMPFAQRALERLVQLLGADRFALFEIQLHQLGIELDHLVDERVVRRFHRMEIGLAGGVEKAVHHIAAALCGQVDRQAGLAEGLLDLREQPRQIDLFRVDAVYDDHPAKLALLGVRHHPRRGHLDARARIDDDGRRFHRGQRADRHAGEVGVAGGVEQVDAGVEVVEVGDGGIEGVVVFAFEGIEIAEGGAAVHAAWRVNRAALVQERFGKRGLAAAGMADQSDRADGLWAVIHGRRRP
ncbi:hypothetical protein PUN4_940040 [Paraburkholderia unamae]|nr:hypothetical protein PUN4_940040 [Paraburkholderia unamae]